MNDNLIHPECDSATHPCFRCKMIFWRRGGVPMNPKGAVINGRPFFHTSIDEQRREIIADAKRGGCDPEPVGNRWV